MSRAISCTFLIFCLFVLDEIQLLAVEMILVFSFFVGVSDSGGEGSENVGSARREFCWHSCGGGVDMLSVAAEAKSCEFPVVGVNSEASLGNCCLVDSHTPH